MSFPEESAAMQMDPGDWERAEAQCGSEEPVDPGRSFTSLSSARAGSKMLTQNPEKFSIHDQDHKVMVLDCGSLIAVPNKSYIRPETFLVLASPLCSAGEHKGSPVFLAVSKGDLCLYCDKKKSQPTLQLKKKKLSHLASKRETAASFTFYRAKVGSRDTLESAAHPGWYICTCSPGEPVTMTDKPEPKKCMELSFVRVDKVEMSPSEVNE